MKWIKTIFGGKDESRNIGLHGVVDKYREGERQIKQAGSFEGRHYTEYIGLAKELKREKKYDEAIRLLHELTTASEREAQVAGWGIAPWYYEQLAIIYRKEERYDEEVKILERYQRQAEESGARPAKLSERLVKARELRDRHRA